MDQEYLTVKELVELIGVKSLMQKSYREANGLRAYTEPGKFPKFRIEDVIKLILSRFTQRPEEDWDSYRDRCDTVAARARRAIDEIIRSRKPGRVPKGRERVNFAARFEGELGQAVEALHGLRASWGQALGDVVSSTDDDNLPF